MKTLPFYSRAREAIVVDSRCECGHLQSEHGSHLTNLPNGQIYRQYEHGSCCTCDQCDQFTWAEFVTEAEALDHLLECSRFKAVA